MLDEKKVPGTCEADCQKFPVTNDSIGIMRAPFEKGAPRSGGGTNLSKRFPAGAMKMIRMKWFPMLLFILMPMTTDCERKLHIRRKIIFLTNESQRQYLKTRAQRAPPSR